MSKPTHFLMNASPIRPVPITATVLPVTSSPKNGKYGCQNPHLFSRVRCSACHIFRASSPIMKKANSAVASVSTSAVCVNGILYRFASARLMLSKPTANWATTFSVPFPAPNTSASIGSRKLVISPSIPELTFSRISFFGGASGCGYSSTSYSRFRNKSSASPISQVANTRNLLPIDKNVSLRKSCSGVFAGPVPSQQARIYHTRTQIDTGRANSHMKQGAPLLAVVAPEVGILTLYAQMGVPLFSFRSDLRRHSRSLRRLSLLGVFPDRQHGHEPINGLDR